MRVAVVGTGNMGQNHLRVYKQLRDVELVGIVEPDPGRAAEMSKRFDCRSFSQLPELLGEVDAVSIASPSSTHADVARFLLTNDVHCLVEKPLALNEGDCCDLIDLAADRGLVLMVGHVERFNPVVEQLDDFLRGGQAIYALDARRMSATSARIHDVDVVMDLMIHDLDIALEILQGKPESIQAQGIRVDGSGWDYVTALVRFSSGTVASFTASRVTQNKVRELQITSDIGYVQADYLRQELHIFRQSSVAATPGRPGGYTLDLSMDQVFVRHSEPLTREISHYVETVKSAGRPRSDGPSALRALKLAWAIRDQLAEQQPLGMR